jgi:pyruvate dehydrogenase E2 component (dihydrolipoamide acetyltransferase)
VLSDGGEADPAEIDALVAGFKAVDASFAADGEDAVPASQATSAPAPEPAAPAIPDGVAISPTARDKAVAAGLDVTALAGSGRSGRITAQDVDQAIRSPGAPALVGVLPPTPSSTVFATPMARRVAVLHDVALDKVTGSGPRGRVRKADVLAAIPAPAPAPVVAPPAGSPVSAPAPVVVPGEVEVLPMSSMRRTIARRLTEAKQQIPHFYVRRRVRADRLLALRAAVQGQRPSINDYLIKACALALMEVPQVNIQVHGQEIHRFGNADIAVAVATEKGLVTPIVRAADELSVAQISEAMTGLAQRARSGKLKTEEFSGGSFSLSNLGSFGVEQFDAIINPPQGAILAVGGINRVPVELEDGGIAFESRIGLTLSVDHRAIDGAAGAQFLATLKRLIEDPEALFG